MNSRWIYGLPLCLLSALSLNANPLVPGSVIDYSVLAGSAVVNTGATVLPGDLGTSPGSAITGSPGAVNGPVHAEDAVAAQALIDANAAYLSLTALQPTSALTGQALGGLTLAPGIYAFANSAQLTGELTPNLLGDPNSLLILQPERKPTRASDSSFLRRNLENRSVIWLIGSSAILGTGPEFRANILALSSITMNTGSSVVAGRAALTRNDDVTLGARRISSADYDVTEAPEPGSLLLLGAGLLGLVFLGWKSRKRAA